MKKRKGLLLAALLAAAALTLSGCGAQQRKTLRVGVKDDVANFGLYDEESGRYSGLEIDLAELLCQELGYSDLELTTVVTPTKGQQIDEDKVDMVIATFSITDERKERYDFSDPYYVDHTAVMVEESSLIDDIQDLLGLRVGMMDGSSNALSMAEYLAERGLADEFDPSAFTPEGFDAVDFVTYDNYDAISYALECGDVDAFLADHSMLSGHMNDGRVILSDEFSTEEFGICTKKGSALSVQVNEALRKWFEDGTIQQLMLKWGV